MHLATRSIVFFAATIIAPALSAQTIDAFNPLPNVPPATIAVQADGKILLGGSFNSVDTFVHQGVVRLKPDGSVDATFADAVVDADVIAIAAQEDGKILVGGTFTHVGGQPRVALARLNANGSLDTSFVDPHLDNTVWSIAIQPDGKVLVAGDFQNIGTTPRKYLARLNANGSFDSSFADPQLCCLPARAVALQSDGHVLVGGDFSQAGGVSHFYFARFSSTGAFDSGFPAVVNPPQVAAIVLAPDGSIFVDDPGTDKVLKFSATGVSDPAYTSAVADSTINAIALQPNGKIVISGIFQNVGGQPRHALARLNADGTFDGTFGDLQFSFDAGNPHGYIYGIAAQTDGNIAVIGNFTLANSQSRQYAARVVTGDAVVNKLTGQASGGNVIVTWARSGAGPELAQPPPMMHSTDGTNYAAVGTLTRIAIGWQETAPYNVAGAPFYLKAVGFTSGGAQNGSPGRIDSPVYVSDRIFADGFD